MVKKTVCHLTSVHHWNDIRIFQKECTALAEAGFEVHLVAANGVNGIYNGVQIHNVEYKSSGRFDRMRNLAKKVYEMAKEIDADIYHFHDPELLPYGLKLQKQGKKVIYDVHEDVPADIHHKYWIKPEFIRTLLSFLYNRYEKSTAKRLSGVISVVEVITDKFQNNNKTTIKNFPSLPNFKPDESVRKNDVIYAGGLMRKRGIKEIIQAIGLTQTKPRLIIYGKWDSAEYENECMNLPEWKYVDFRGYVPLEETYKAMASAKVGLCLPADVGQNRYSLPIKSFEYMASGLAAVNSNFPFWEKLFGETAIYVNPSDIKLIAEAIDKLLLDEAYCKKLSENGRDLVLNSYNWEAEKEKLITFYHQIDEKG